MSDEKKSSILRFAGGPTTPEQAARLEPSAVEKSDYRAADIDRSGSQRRLLAIQSNGTMRVISYSYFVEAISSDPALLSFVYTNGVLSMRGENLRSLLPHLQTEEITTLRPFDANLYHEPGPGEPVIDDLWWETVDELLAQSQP